MAEGPLAPHTEDGIPVDAHKKLIAYTIGPQDIDLTFRNRVAHENGWDLAKAERAVQEYKRFAYLCAHSRTPCTPSMEIDQVWHMHMTYTRDYWGKFCPHILGYELHHGPTEGGDDEDQKHIDQYEYTLLYYEQVFGRPPPSDLWPSTKERFSSFPHLQWVNLSEYSITPKSKIYLAIVLTAVVSFILGSLLPL